MRAANFTGFAYGFICRGVNNPYLPHEKKRFRQNRTQFSSRISLDKKLKDQSGALHSTTHKKTPIRKMGLRRVSARLHIQNKKKLHLRFPYQSRLFCLWNSSLENWKLFLCVSLRLWNVGKITSNLHETEGFHAKIRCNLNGISYLSETQKNNFQFL